MKVLEKQIFPSSWEEAHITVIRKEKQDLENIKNYCPISLLNTDYKIFTSILADRFKKIENLDP